MSTQLRAYLVPDDCMSIGPQADAQIAVTVGPCDKWFKRLGNLVAFLVFALWLNSTEAEDLSIITSNLSGDGTLLATASSAAPVEPAWLVERFEAVYGAFPRSAELDEVREPLRRCGEESVIPQLLSMAKSDTAGRTADVYAAFLLGEAGALQAMRAKLEQMMTAAQPEAYLLAADIAVRERRCGEAELGYAKVAELLKSVLDPPRKRRLQETLSAGHARLAEARRQWPKAQKDWEAVLASIPSDTGHAAQRAETLRRIASIVFMQRDAKAALKILQAADAASPPNNGSAEAILSEFYAAYGDPQNAQKWVLVALRKHPDDLRACLLAAKFFWDENHLKRARMYAEKAIHISPASFDARALLGTIALIEKNYKAAESDLQAAHSQSPRDVAAANNLAIALCEQGDAAKKERAMEIAETNFRDHSDNIDAMVTYGWILRRLGKASEAETVFRVLRFQRPSWRGLATGNEHYIER
jgi:tetratricopeptide (TPR) repeat protein